MMTDAELEQTMFLNIKSIDGLDTDDDFYEYKKAVLEDEVIQKKRWLERH